MKRFYLTKYFLYYNSPVHIAAQSEQQNMINIHSLQKHDIGRVIVVEKTIKMNK